MQNDASVAAVGCPDLKKPSNGWLKRNSNQMTAGCIASEVTWTLDCVGTEWHGTAFNCSLGRSQTVGADFWNDHGARFPLPSHSPSPSLLPSLLPSLSSPFPVLSLIPVSHSHSLSLPSCLFLLPSPCPFPYPLMP